MLISEIARLAQVSPATVSRAVNQPELVSAESLARIRAVMQAHNYVAKPSGARRGPKARDVRRRIGVWFVGGSAGNPNLGWFEQQLLKAQAHDARYAIDLRLLFSRSEAELPPGFAAEGLDGIILQGLEPSAACLAQLRELPHVWFMTRRSSTFPGDYVEPNNEENGRVAAEYLHARGHRRVAVVSTEPDYPAVARRTVAFLARAQELGLEAQTVLGRTNPAISFLELMPRHEEATSLVRQLDASPERATGLYLPVDHFCGAFFRALRDSGHEPGRDYEAVLGNYNPVIYHNLDHSPAAIDINLSLLVRKVMDHLFWRIDNPHVEGRIGVAISPQLIHAAPPVAS